MKQLTNDNYFDDDEYMSVSAFKKLAKCELDAGISTNPKSSALLIGSYVDAFVEGTLEKFKEENPEVFSTRGASKGGLKAEFKQADDICEYIQNNKVIQQFLSGDKQTIMTGVIEGVPFKIKMDAYSADKAIVDLKCMRSVTDSKGNFYDFITPWGYDIQLACYQEIVRQNTGKKLPCFIVAVTKETPINSVIIQIPQHFLDVALYNVQSQIKHLYDVKMKKVDAVGCGVCPLCVALRKTTPIISLSDIILG